MHANLSFEQAPPISVPYRFFLTAPWFGAAAGLLLLWSGEEAMASRWTPASLALTHLLAAGFMLQAMLGALLQFVPVAAGGNVWRPSRLAAFVHPLLVLALLLLVAGFLAGGEFLYRAAGGCFLAAIGGYVLVVGVALLRAPAKGGTILALRLAMAGLAVTATLGTVLAEGLSGDHGWPLLQWVDVHAAWGLAGWALMLLAGVSYYVVPMFQLTPAYPPRFALGLPGAMLLLLLLWSWQLDGTTPGWIRLVWFAGLLLAASYATMTLRLQNRRRRKLVDATFWFFRGGMLSLLVLAASAVVLALVPSLGQHPRAPVWLGVLVLVGVFVSVINGMLYKIAPFMNWLHMQRLGGLAVMPPPMRDMVPERATRAQLLFHFAALGLLLLAVVWPPASRPAGLVFALSCGGLAWNLIGALRVYRDFRDRIPAAAAGRAP